MPHTTESGASEQPIPDDATDSVIRGTGARSYRKVWIAIAGVTGAVLVVALPGSVTDDVRTTALYTIGAIASVAITGNGIEHWKKTDA